MATYRATSASASTPSPHSFSSSFMLYMIKWKLVRHAIIIHEGTNLSRMVHYCMSQGRPCNNYFVIPRIFTRSKIYKNGQQENLSTVYGRGRCIIISTTTGARSVTTFPWALLAMHHVRCMAWFSEKISYLWRTYSK